MVSSEAILAMKSMAKDPKKRVALAKDATCVGGLIIVLSNADSTIVVQALQTLLLLCESHDSQKLLQSHVGIKEQLELIDNNITFDSKFSSLEFTVSADLNVKQLAKDLFTKLSEQTAVPLRDSSNIRRSSSNRINSHGETKTKSIVLQIRGLHDKSDRDLCSRLLLNVKGVVSITYDLNKKRCILRTKSDVKAEALASAITRSMTMVAHQVIRNEKGEESLLSFNSSLNNQGDAATEVIEFPDYLSDDSDQSFSNDRALKPPSQEDMKKSAGWFSAAASFLSNSFYW